MPGPAHRLQPGDHAVPQRDQIAAPPSGRPLPLSGDELDAALKAARRAIEYCLKEASAGTNTGRTLEAIERCSLDRAQQSLTAARRAASERAAMNKHHP